LKEEKIEQLRIAFWNILRKYLKEYISELEIADINNELLYEVKIRINNK